MEGRQPSRAAIAGAAVLTHVCLGSVYAWSVAVPALQRQTGWTRPQLAWAFSFAIAALGLTAALAAWLRESLGSYTAILGACALASGLGLALVRALARAVQADGIEDAAEAMS
jgi:OFA family oxalate/formate antiporter-like MFS transporter